MPNYLHIASNTLHTPKSMEMKGFNVNDTETLNRAGYAVVSYAYITDYDATFVTPVAKKELTRVDEFHYTQEFELTNKPIDSVKSVLKERATAYRWKVETAGIRIEGVGNIMTGLDDQNRISSTITGMQKAGIASVDFKTSDGWTKVTVEQLDALAAAIATHVEGCFSQERKLHETIDKARTVASLQKIDITAGWPAHLDFADDADAGAEAKD